MGLLLLPVEERFTFLQCPEYTKALPTDLAGSRRTVSSQGLTGCWLLPMEKLAQDLILSFFFLALVRLVKYLHIIHILNYHGVGEFRDKVIQYIVYIILVKFCQKYRCSHPFSEHQHFLKYLCVRGGSQGMLPSQLSVVQSILTPLAEQFIIVLKSIRCFLELITMPLLWEFSFAQDRDQFCTATHYSQP